MIKNFNELKGFTYKAYINLLSYLQTRYSIIPFNKIPSVTKPYVILRHDIDASLKQALNMAVLESKLNIKSTYFVLFSHKYYNLFGKDNMNELREISNLGHEIGLHYDLEAYSEYKKNPFKVLEQEIQLLESIIGKKIVSIACHNISMVSMEDPLRNAKYINAYDRSLYDLYVSDSCRAWNLGDLTRLLSLKCSKVQLLIHPFLWTKNKVNRSAVIECLFNNISSRNVEFRDNWINLWNSSNKVIEYDKEIRQS